MARNPAVDVESRGFAVFASAEWPVWELRLAEHLTDTRYRRLFGAGPASPVMFPATGAPARDGAT